MARSFLPDFRQILYRGTPVMHTTNCTNMSENNITEICSVREGTLVPDKDSNTWIMVPKIGQLAVSRGLTVLKQCGNILFTKDRGLLIRMDMADNMPTSRNNFTRNRHVWKKLQSNL